MGGLDDDMSELGDMGALDQEKINEFRTLVRDARDAWQEATERIEAAFHANYNEPSMAEERLAEAKEAAFQAMDKAWAAYTSAHNRGSKHRCRQDERILQALRLHSYHPLCITRIQKKRPLV